MSATAILRARPTRVVPWARLGDEMLAGRAAGGNEAAFAALYERYYGPLLGYTRSMLLDPEGKLALRSIGPIDENYLEANVTPLVEGGKPE